ncbi:MAG: hypothetical protein JJU18_04515 [Oceanicaulis sp.]|nr:hypothetical protein [Oceanicaulis sp.]
MTAPPGQWIAAAGIMIVRIAAVFLIAARIGELAYSVFAEQLMPHIHTSDSYAVFAGAFAISAGACAVAALAAPALLAWSQAGAARHAGEGEALDRGGRAMILVAALLVFLINLPEMARTLLIGWIVMTEPRDPALILAEYWTRPEVTLPVFALIVMLLSPALGAALNTARRALQSATRPNAAASSGNPA